MRPGEAVMELSRIGFQFRLDGEAIKVRFEGNEIPDPAAVSPLLDVVKAHKAEVLDFLKSCQGCAQYVAKEVETHFPAFCLYHSEGLLADNPLCRNYREGHVPKEPVRCPRCSGVATCPDYEGRSLCMACDWGLLVELYPGLQVKH